MIGAIRLTSDSAKGEPKVRSWQAIFLSKALSELVNCHRQFDNESKGGETKLSSNGGST
jgi:hypothetical protein